MNELISVIVPIYNVENYIEKCLKSIVDQTYRNLEIILIDDESPDKCGIICDEYAKKDNRIKVIHKTNGGLSSARNAALDMITGSWVTCIDSDDYVHPDMIKRLYEAAIKDNAQISICSHYEEFKDKLLIKDRVYDEVKIWDSHTALIKLVEDEEVKNYAWGKLYKAELFEGVRYPDGRNYEDIATTYYLFDKVERIVKIPDYLYFYLIRDGGISFNSSTATWHKGCHATCIGQEERASYFKTKGYEDLYELSMSKLLPYLYSDIRSGYIVSAEDDIKETKLYLKNNANEFYNNKLISEKDKGLVNIYLLDETAYKIYFKSKNAYLNCVKNIRKIRKKFCHYNNIFDFTLAKGKTKRIIYFELPCFDNLGDHAIAYATENIIESKCKEHSDYQLFIIDGWGTDRAINSLKKCIRAGDVIVCQGGGNFGNLYEFAEVFRRKVLNEFRNNRIIIMPQTLFYSNDEQGKKELVADIKTINACNNITIFARDAKSYELMKGYFDCRIEQLHDVVSLYDATNYGATNREGIIVCLRSDKESTLCTKDKLSILAICEQCSDNVFVTDTCVQYDFESKIRFTILEKKFKLFGKSQLVITDRLHGMIFSIITETPCIVIGNNHHKVYETYKTFASCSYIKYVKSLENLNVIIHDMMKCKIDERKLDLSGDIEVIANSIFD
ncbi:glycosyltransferase [Butyrivibrio sp. AE3004]|uniref:glycosyltransferase n=1 Tax=Butyrivibrio sp. AE3004 TaxID=1506994 RepID=UPI00068D20C6|nr:glycosyltransferase [Butyrivibrio sp. AE3004]